MFEAKITIETPGLSQALNRLADAMAGHTTPAAPAPAPVAPPEPPVAPAPVPTMAPPAAPVTPPAPVPTVPPAATPPLAPAPSYTLEQINRAGADFVTAHPDKYPDLMALLGQFGISTVSQLKPEQYGAMATALRGLGAKL